VGTLAGVDLVTTPVHQTTTPIVALGRELVQNLLVALRSAQLYEPTNATMRASAERLTRTIREIIATDGGARIEAGHDVLLVNDVRVRGELRSYSVHTALLRLFRSLEIGGFEWSAEPTREEVALFSRVVGRLEGGPATTPERLAARIRAARVEGVEVLGPRHEVLTDIPHDEDRRARAEKVYRDSVAVTKQLMESMRAGRSLRRVRVKRAVQSIVDQVLEDETLILGLTNLRDYDHPTFTHSVNVCIFAISLGQKIGLGRLELYELGMAALLHDIGKVDVPKDVLQKPGALTDEEWEEMRRHTVYGAWRILEERQGGTIPLREILVAFEHHLNIDRSGYPALHDDRKLSFFSKIVSIVDSFDAGTTPRVYQTEPTTPAEMLEVLDQWKGIRYDPILLKAFIGLLGVYPPGTLVLLDTLEMGIVVQPDPDPSQLHRPRVHLVADSQGNRVDGPVVRLAERDDRGEHPRSIIKVLDADRYDVDIARYFRAHSA